MRRVAAALMACLFLGASAWMFLNEETVEAWLTQQVVSQSTETIHQLPLQDNESWLVVVVDFEQHTADNGWGPTEAKTMLDQAVVPYIQQLSGGDTELTIDVHEIRLTQRHVLRYPKGIDQGTTHIGHGHRSDVHGISDITGIEITQNEIEVSISINVTMVDEAVSVRDRMQIERYKAWCAELR